MGSECRKVVFALLHYTISLKTAQVVEAQQNYVMIQSGFRTQQPRSQAHPPLYRKAEESLGKRLVKQWGIIKQSSHD